MQHMHYGTRLYGMSHAVAESRRAFGKLDCHRKRVKFLA
jgi:hypothetical protein